MKGRRALITGASGGIGKAIAAAFRAAGAVILAPDLDELELTSNKSIDAYLAAIGGKADILVNSAGINPLGSAEEFSDEDLAAVMQIDLHAPMRLMRGLLPHMRRKKYGRIVNISSIWGLVTKPRRFAYTAAKTGLVGVTRAAAVECSRYGVLVNAVAPGFVDTAMTRMNNSPADIRAIAKTIPAGRLARPAEIAAAVAFLASAKNTYITGQTIAVDGGYTCL